MQQEKKSSALSLIIALVVIAAIGFGAWTYLNRTAAPSEDDLLVDTPSTAEQGIDGDLISALRDLQRLKLDDSIFSNPVWLSLRDFGRSLAPQASGRTNPFAPIGGVDYFPPGTSGTTTPN